ncbi:MAG: hypothetical protein VX589_21420, partial [Myxococcota bacterium]|nr:hypothetical protein [Myxococcota bacterium]
MNRLSVVTRRLFMGVGGVLIAQWLAGCTPSRRQATSMAESNGDNDAAADRDAPRDDLGTASPEEITRQAPDES